MFILMEKGEVYVCKIKEFVPELGTLDHLEKAQAEI